MKNIRLFYVLVAIIVVMATPAFAAENFAGDFLMLGSGARALGMGSSFVAATDGATAAYYNPAGLAGTESREINFMHSEQFGGLENYNTVSFSSKFSETLYGGISLIHLGVGDIKYTRLWDPTNPAISDSNRVEIASREDANDYALYFAGARRFSEKLNVGGAVKVIRRAIGSDTAFGFGIDAGVQYSPTPHWRLGISLKDITGTTIAWDGHSNDRIALTMDSGIAYYGELPIIGGDYIMTGSLPFFGDSPDEKGLETMHLGLEYLIHDYVAVRAGSSRSDMTFGFGVMRLPLLSSSSLDYAFLSHEQLDSTHRVSMTVKF